MKRMLLLICSTLSFLPLLGGKTIPDNQIIPMTTPSYPQADNQQAPQMPYLATMNNTTTQQPNKTICKVCCDCADSCCNDVAHNGCNLCCSYAVNAWAVSARLAMDVAWFPFACLIRPCRGSNDRERNNCFCYCTRKYILERTDVKECCGIDITLQ